MLHYYHQVSNFVHVSFGSYGYLAYTLSEIFHQKPLPAAAGNMVVENGGQVRDNEKELMGTAEFDDLTT